MEAINESRIRIWKQQPESFFEQAVIEADGTILKTNGECKEGMDISYKGIWGYQSIGGHSRKYRRTSLHN